MKQIINLLNSLPKKRDIVLPLSLMLKIYVVFLMVLAGLYFSVYYHVNALEKSLFTLREQEKLTTISVVTLTKALSSMVEKSNVGKKSTSLKMEIKGKEAILKKLMTMSLEPGKGFYHIFMGLERGAIKGAWVNIISIKRDGGVTLQGQAISSKEVLGFVNNLNRQKEFNKYPFKLATLQRGSGEGEDQTKFELSSPYQFGDKQ